MTDIFLSFFFLLAAQIGMHRGLIAAQIQNVEKIIEENGGHESKGKCHMLVQLITITNFRQVFSTWISSNWKLQIGP